MACSVKLTDLVGKPFVWDGRGPDGYDCYGLMIEVRKRSGKFMPDWYPSLQDRKMLNEVLLGSSKNCGFIKIPEPKPFCIVGFMIRPPYTSHIGMVLEDRVRFIHVLQKANVCIERLDSSVWAKRISGYWELADA